MPGHPANGGGGAGGTVPPAAAAAVATPAPQADLFPAADAPNLIRAQQKVRLLQAVAAAGCRDGSANCAAAVAA